MSPINELMDISLNIFQSNIFTNDARYKNVNMLQYFVTKCYLLEVDLLISKIIRRIPLSLIENIFKEKGIYIFIVSKFGSIIKLKFSTEEICSKVEKDLLKNMSYRKLICECQTIENSFTFNNNQIKVTVVDEYYSILCEEFKRMQFDFDKWEITKMNEDFKLSPTYPKYHIVLKNTQKEDFQKIIAFRSQGRFPSVTYRSKYNGAVLIRCGQPLITDVPKRCIEEENYFRQVIKCTKYSSKKIILIDARSEESAFDNFYKGGGTENMDHYNMAEQRFLNIPNMIHVKEYFEAWIKDIFIKKDIEILRRSDWVLYITRMLDFSRQISRLIHVEGLSVIIHCSDGWDRTPQLTSLSKLLIDPFYRTITGFQILIEQEWRQMGHKFGERCAIGSYKLSKEYSPIFIQWLDCVYQIIIQFPKEFEFNENLLVKLAIHVYSGVFNNFHGNFMKERYEKYNPVMDMWSYFLAETVNDVNNTSYFPSKEILTPKYSSNDIQIWNELYQNNLEII